MLGTVESVKDNTNLQVGLRIIKNVTNEPPSPSGFFKSKNLSSVLTSWHKYPLYNMNKPDGNSRGRKRGKGQGERESLELGRDRNCQALLSWNTCPDPVDLNIVCTLGPHGELKKYRGPGVPGWLGWLSL